MGSELKDLGLSGVGVLKFGALDFGVGGWCDRRQQQRTRSGASTRNPSRPMKILRVWGTTWRLKVEPPVGMGS